MWKEKKGGWGKRIPSVFQIANGEIYFYSLLQLLSSIEVQRCFYAVFRVSKSVSVGQDPAVSI